MNEFVEQASGFFAAFQLRASAFTMAEPLPLLLNGDDHNGLKFKGFENAFISSPDYQFSTDLRLQQNKLSPAFLLGQRIRCWVLALLVLSFSFGNSQAQQNSGHIFASDGNPVFLSSDTISESFSSTDFHFQAGHPDQIRTDEPSLDSITLPTEASFSGGMPTDLKSLMKPTFSFGSEWVTGSDFDLSNFELKVTVPTYPFFGPPPPLVSFGVAYTNLADAKNFDLPSDLYTYSLGLAWVRNLNERWKLRTMAGVAMATDNQNTSAEAWQFRGGVFAVYEPNDRWQWVFGGIALGRRDLPFVPAIGAIWQPTHITKYDLTFPRPKFSRLISEYDSRQQWAYIGLELNGGTWAYETSATADELLTYGDWRAVVGWESLPASAAGAMFTPGRRWGLKGGYVFARDIQRSEDAPEIDLSNGIIFGIDGRY